MELDLLVCGALIVFSWMMVGYLIYLARKNAAIVDFFWASAVFLISFFYFLSGEFSSVSITSFILVSLWSLKLLALLWMRLERDQVDGRYERLNRLWREKRNLKYFLFFIVQAFFAFLISLPLFFTTQGDLSHPLLIRFGFVVILIGFVGEGIADVQLQRFKKKATKKVCEEGLWAYSRHPNYFFEWIFWVGQFLFALTAPFGWVSILSPISLLITLLFFSGIPPAEKQALSSKGRAYKKYQKRVSPFFPWFRRE